MIKNFSKYLFFKNPIYHLYLSRHADKGFIINPNSLWSGNKKNGNRFKNSLTEQIKNHLYSEKVLSLLVK